MRRENEKVKSLRGKGTCKSRHLYWCCSYNRDNTLKEERKLLMESLYMLLYGIQHTDNASSVMVDSCNGAKVDIYNDDVHKTERSKSKCYDLRETKV